MNKYVSALMFIILGAAVGYFGRGSLVKPSAENEVRIEGVIDGDTVVTAGNSKIRLRQVDAPELGNCGADEATNLLKELVQGRTVKLTEVEFDQSAGHRPMYLVYEGQTLVNKELLAAGWARYHSDKTTVTDELKAAAEAAKTNKIGIFSQMCTQTENRLNPKCNIKGNIDPNNSSVRIYQMPGCVQYKTTTVDLDRGEQWFCTETEAKKAGYVKSKRCP